MASCRVWLSCNDTEELFDARINRPYLEGDAPLDYGDYYESAFNIDVNDTLTFHDCYFLLNDSDCYPIGYQHHVLSLSHFSFTVRIIMCSIFLLLLFGGQILSVLVISAFRKQHKSISNLFKTPFAVIMISIMVCNVFYQLGLQCFVCTVLLFGHNNEYMDLVASPIIPHLLTIQIIILTASYEINIIFSFLLALNRFLIFFNEQLNKTAFSPIGLIFLKIVIWTASVAWGIIFYGVMTCHLTITYFAYYTTKPRYLDHISNLKCTWSNLVIYYFHIVLIIIESFVYVCIFLKLNWKKILNFVKSNDETAQTILSTSRRKDINILYQCLIIFLALAFENATMQFNYYLYETMFLSDDIPALDFGNFPTVAVNKNYGLLLDVASILLLIVRISRSLMHAVMMLMFNTDVRKTMSSFVSTISFKIIATNRAASIVQTNNS